MSHFLSGIFAATFSASGVFFFFFWRQTRDIFFLYFAIATWLLAFERLPLAIVEMQHENRPLVYLVRLVASTMILVAMVQKNLVRARA